MTLPDTPQNSPVKLPYRMELELTIKEFLDQYFISWEEMTPNTQNLTEQLMIRLYGRNLIWKNTVRYLRGVVHSGS